MTALRDWLDEQGLGQLLEVLEANEVDLDTLRILSDADLQELGIPFGPRKRLRHALQAAAQAARPTPARGAAAVPDADGERRQLTALFCDMVGFTELASRLDPEVLRDVIRRYEDTCAACITRYDGYVFQRLGDGIVAFFGYPMAHEGEAERAVRAGLDIVEAFAREEVPHAGRLQVRVGIATGMVVVSTAERSAVGETMNLAARLQALAVPGTIVVSDRVRRLAGGAFAWTDLGEHALKGIAKPTHAWRVDGESAVASRFEAATVTGVSPFVGREQEMALLLEAWRDSRAGHGRVVLLGGEPGIGKSRTVSDACDRLAAAGAQALRLQCSPFHVNSALHPFIDHVSRQLGFAREDTPAHRLDVLEAFVHGTLGRPVEDAAYIAALLTLPWRERWTLPPLAPRLLKAEGIRALIDAYEAVARSRPTVLLFEDAHWADPSSVDVLGQVVARLERLPLLVLVTHRPEFSSPWAQAWVTSQDLGRLKSDESRAIVTRLAGDKALPGSLADEIVAKADGIPLFLEELTKSVLESDALRDAGDRYAIAEGASVELPATLRDSLMARLDRQASVKAVAQLGAAIGRDFNYDLLAAVSPMAPDALATALERLVESGLAFQRGAVPRARYTFKHALVQDVAYESLLKSRRQELHRDIARALESLAPGIREQEPELVARHLAAGGQEAESIPLWRRAGEMAMQRLALPEAVGHVRTGIARLAALPGGADRDRLELGLRTLLGPAEVARKGWAAPEVLDALEPAWALNQSLGDHASSMPVLHGLWVCTMTKGQLDVSLGWAEQMLEAGARWRDEGLEICGHRAAMTTYFWMGRFADARRHGDEVVHRYDPDRHGQIVARIQSDPYTGDGIYRAHYLWMLGFPDQARAVAAATAAHARQRKQPFDAAFALTLGSQVHEYCGEPERLLACAEEAIRIGREFGMPLMSEMMAEISRGEAWLLQGRDEDALPELSATLDRLAGTGHRVWTAYLQCLVGAAMGRLGRAAEGLAHVDAQFARADTREDQVHRAEMHRIRGELLVALGREDEAMAAFGASRDVARTQDARGWELRTAMSIARLLAARGDAAGARSVLGPLHARFTEGQDTRDVREAGRLLATLADAS